MVRGRVQTQTPAVTCRSRAQPGELQQRLTDAYAFKRNALMSFPKRNSDSFVFPFKSINSTYRTWHKMVKKKIAWGTEWEYLI